MIKSFHARPLWAADSTGRRNIPQPALNVDKTSDGGVKGLQ